MASRCFRVGLVLLCAVMCSAAQGQESVATLSMEGLENKPFRLRLFHPLSETLTLLEEGQVGMEGQLTLTWPDDGQLHLLELECAGIVWSLPVCGPYTQGAKLTAPPLGGAPFSERPGSVLWAEDVGREWTPILVSQAQAILSEYERATAADLQQSMLWNGAGRASKVNVGEVLGASIGEAPVAANQDSLWSVYQAGFQREYDELLDRCSPGAERGYIEALRWGIWPELYPDSALRWKEEWAGSALPAPDDAGGVAYFLQGLNRSTGFEGWSMEERQKLRKALLDGEMDSLAAATAVWWGRTDVDRTKAWFLARLGDGGLGVQFPQRFERQMEVPAGVFSLLAECEDHLVLGASAKRLKEKCRQPGALPGALRAFSASGSLIRLEDMASSGPVAWLWLDASAPTTVIQLQVLERMMTSGGGQRRGGNAPLRDLKWVVVDAGQDWTAFEQLIRKTAARYGGLRKLPFEMLHTGGDVRWTEAFELQTLPAMRHSGPGLVPTPETPPLPGPALIDWLSKRS
ncbi:MAG: hypothetical protein L7S67_09040 [Flavobacteriales bacterium]|nr:hypothetical protein [Flavobacteriales bacterium]